MQNIWFIHPIARSSRPEKRFNSVAAKADCIFRLNWVLKGTHASPKALMKGLYLLPGLYVGLPCNATIATLGRASTAIINPYPARIAAPQDTPVWHIAKQEFFRNSRSIAVQRGRVAWLPTPALRFRLDTKHNVIGTYREGPV